MRKKACKLLAAGAVICVGISGCGNGGKNPQEYPADMASPTENYSENAAAAESVPVLEAAEEIKSYLAKFPVSKLSEELSGQPCYVIAHGEEKSGRKYVDAFMEKVQAKESAALVCVQYTEEGDPVLDYLSYDGEYFYRIHDRTRDNWAGDEKYREYIYTDVWTELGMRDEIREEGDRTEREAALFFAMYADSSYYDGLPEALFCVKASAGGQALLPEEGAGETLSSGGASPQPDPCPEDAEEAAVMD